ncbi:tRNA pseudouridine(65) synthase TruC [Alysiella filiformis]|uniref:tRNA pseudouridine synthase C n=1 Tax=Alysiella filiformis DSM 16848 TaxID=1120981 RepID=A0A286EI56_9NEIS|nr:tRNA pseudouridine(65) synthase TruC [Alysiella filiformis]QMT31938.1 tRNA pseudouridine(65) synthase TruC [Alysiella filiformis]UBQ57154.1 tRNA pseudouridine(65) synthase TruC [Alysiella filiformis DSM 16848]SOD70610.1 tRNA pseudouridine65 synthase [Alysiella filiformis DSM 16848]
MIQIIHQNPSWLLVNKPAGMLVHRSWLDTHETVFLMQTLRDQIGQHVYPIHRLDRPTSGIMLFALNSDTARLLVQQFESQQIQKDYLAIVRGWTADSGSIDYPLKVQLDDIADELSNPNKPAQAARTDYCTLARTELPFSSNPRFVSSRYSLLHITPHTGRKHQIRRHLKHIFHPIVGDTTHGDLRQNKAVQQFCGNTRLLLHAQSLQFLLPETGEMRQFHAPVDEDWQNVCRAFGFEVESA